jgi:hypothetical protein
MKRPRWLVKAAVLATLAFGGFALAGVLSGVGLATDTGTTTTDTGTTTTDTGTTTTDTTITTTTTTTTTTPPGGEGCTPGFWKTHPEAWVGYDPDDTLGSVFANVPASVAGTSLLDAMSFSGGPTLLDKKKLLLHHAVAALLNAAHPGIDYAFTEAQVITWTSDMLLSTDKDAVLGLKNLFDAENNRGCFRD